MDQTAVVRIGHYSLEVGSRDGAFALVQLEPEQDRAAELAEALREPDEPAGAALDQVLEDAAAVTSRGERCLRLFNAVAQGHVLNAKVVSEEVDALVSLAARLDRAGRRKEALRLVRDLAALLALLLRWLDLVRSLRLALRIARSLGDLPGEAWALHELGSLQLVAGDPAGASKRLAEAVQIKDGLGGGHGRCASRHNLDAARRELAHDASRRGWRARRLPLAATLFVLALLTGGGTALGLTLGGPGSNPHPPATTSTTGTTSSTTNTSSTTTSTPHTTTTPPVVTTTVTDTTTRTPSTTTTTATTTATTTTTTTTTTTATTPPTKGGG